MQVFKSDKPNRDIYRKIIWLFQSLQKPTLPYAVLVGALRTLAVAVMVAEWVVVLDAPQPRPLGHIHSCAASGGCQLVLLDAVVVATEPNDITIVTAADGHHDLCGPIKSDHNAKITLDYAFNSRLCYGDAACFKKDR